MYNKDFAAKNKRKKISKCEDTTCKLCVNYANAASFYEWPCLILKDWICETHCYEIQDEEYLDTRNNVLKMLGDKVNPKQQDDLLAICSVCPYSYNKFKQ